MKQQLAQQMDAKELYRKKVSGMGQRLRRDVLLPLSCFGCLGVFIAFMAWSSYMIGSAWTTDNISHFAGVLVLVYVPIAFVYMGSWSPGKSAKGRALLEQARGFEQHLTSTPLDEFEYEHRPEELAEFYGFALALRAEKSFAVRVNDLLGQQWFAEDSLPDISAGHPGATSAVSITDRITVLEALRVASNDAVRSRRQRNATRRRRPEVS